MSDLIIALEEEIGNPGLFTGREAELTELLHWCEQSKEKYSKSKAILSRRKKGKTALVQRLFNILYTRNDPMVVPFFFRVREGDAHLVNFAVLFYRTFLSQLLGFMRREPFLIKEPASLNELETLVTDDPILADNLKTFKETLSTTPDLLWDHVRDSPRAIAAAPCED